MTLLNSGPTGVAPLTGPTSVAAATLDIMREVLEERFGVDGRALTLDQRIDALGLDSLSFVEYAFEVEKRLSVVLPDLPRDLVTIGDLARFVQIEVDAQARTAKSTA
jgi:acyl carrier protein